MNILLAILLSLPAFASWHYNEDAGFGIYEPEGWSVDHEGRSSRLTGPANDSAQSEIFLGSDWQSAVKTADDLQQFALSDSGASRATPITISGLAGYRVGTAEEGAYYVLRIPENVIEITYDLRGSKAQKSEGKTMLSSIEIRTKGNEYP